ncbi:hypothetical protein BON30_26470 [Cystobacter ferrugineus]|uniref:Coenzyme Q-binding protein COQ10 START domain-containing protein n=2 Tax=Cystobacter ferrugineus TaxID=83449 RepID=A0A1L9B652_9BACT|nr:hypothetical protein BON30_26470 [Cystobacter ferrugineus]
MATEALASGRAGRDRHGKGAQRHMKALVQDEATPLTARVDKEQLEKMASVVLGGALLTLGLQRRSLGGTVMALASSGLLYRGLRGLRQLASNPRDRREEGAQTKTPSVEHAITIGKPADELYRLWREPGNLAQVMSHFAELSTTSAEYTHWRVSGPLGQDLEWDTRIVEDRPGELLRWESVEGALLPNQGLVRFRPAPGDWGTEVTLHLDFQPPGGALGEAVLTRLLAVPDLLVNRALRRFKSLAETGEIPTTGRNPSAREGAHLH